METFHEAVAAAIRGWAASARIKQEEIAHVLGTKQQNVSSRMSGKVPFSVDELHAIATHWNLNAPELLQESRRAWLQSHLGLAADEDSDPTEDERLRQEHPDDEVS